MRHVLSCPSGPQARTCLLAAHSSLLESISDDDLESVIGASQEGSTENLTVKPSVARRRANLQETENLYFTVSPTLLYLYFTITL